MAGRGLLRLLVVAVAAASLTSGSAHSTASAQGSATRTVLVLYWSSENFPGTHELGAAIRAGLGSDSERIDYFAEFLESDRFPTPDASEAFRDYIRRKYRARKIDVVVAITDVALNFVLRYRADIFPDAQVVFSATSAPDAKVRDVAGELTGLVLGDGIDDTLELALRLHPSTRRVFYVVGYSDPGLGDAVRAQLEPIRGNLELRAIRERSIAPLLTAIEAVPAGSVILFIRHSQEDPGNLRYPADVASLVAKASRVPVYGIVESYMGTGIVGGMIASRQAIGSRLAGMARQILDGKRARDIPFAYPSLVPILDWRQLRRWHITEDSLPAGSLVLFREISAWERYRTAILIASAVVVLQSGLIAALVFERRRRRSAEIESRRNLAALAHMDRRAAMGELATSLAHELNQPLNAILQNAGVAQMLLTATSVPPALEEITEIISDIRKDDLRASEVIRRMRGLLQKHEFEARPVDLSEVAQDTVAIVQADARSRQIDVELELSDHVAPILGDRVHLQQVLLNLLMNAMDAVAGQPPGRRRVRVSTTQFEDDVRLAVSDTGVGIPVDGVARIFEPFYTTKSAGSGMGMGLAIARGIVEAHAGRMAAESNPDGGATVWCSLPVTRDSVA